MLVGAHAHGRTCVLYFMFFVEPGVFFFCVLCFVLKTHFDPKLGLHFALVRGYVDEPVFILCLSVCIVC